MSIPHENIEKGDFDQIETAVMETERGRWFLREYARRQRAAETAAIVAAIDKLAAHASAWEAEHAEARREAAEASRALADTLAKLQAFSRLTPARGQASQPIRVTAAETCQLPPRTGLDRRLSALKDLDALDVESKVKLIG